MIKRPSSWISDWYKGRVVLSGLTAIWNSTQEFLISFYTWVCTWPRPKISEYFPDGETIVNIGLNGKALCFPLHILFSRMQAIEVFLSTEPQVIWPRAYGMGWFWYSDLVAPEDWDIQMLVKRPSAHMYILHRTTYFRSVHYLGFTQSIERGLTIWQNSWSIICHACSILLSS